MHAPDPAHAHDAGGEYQASQPSQEQAQPKPACTTHKLPALGVAGGLVRFFGRPTDCLPNGRGSELMSNIPRGSRRTSSRPSYRKARKSPVPAPPHIPTQLLAMLPTRPNFAQPGPLLGAHHHDQGFEAGETLSQRADPRVVLVQCPQRSFSAPDMSLNQSACYVSMLP